MKEKKILCPKCKNGDLDAVTLVPLLLGYDIHEGQVVGVTQQNTIEAISTLFKCKKCLHAWRSKRKLPFSIKIEKEK